MKNTVLLSLLLLCSLHGYCGSLDTTGFAALNARRIHTDLTGMKVLGAWGIVNTVGGIVGAIAAYDTKWKRFHEMNAAWGVINLSIAGLGYIGARRELGKHYSATQDLHRYEATKRLYLLNGGLDGLYIATGIFLKEHAKHSSQSDLYRGFGSSLVLQGAGLLLFDITMFTAHQNQDKRWYRALQGLSISGNGIGWNWVIN